MTGSDDDFEDFLRRRKPRFRAPDDMFEPPAELDRVVLRQAREAIESERPVRVFHGPRWAAPLALAATLVLAITVVFQAGMPPKSELRPEVTVQNVAERVEIPQAAPSSPAASEPAIHQPREDKAAGDAVVVDVATPAPMVARNESAAAAAPSADSGFVSNDEAERYAPPPPPAAPVVARKVAESAAAQRGMASDSASTVVIASPPAMSTEIPPWRSNAKTWLAEIERLRKAGDTERADAEYAEFKRQQRAYASGPDR